jgi:hypothetical protein
VSTWLIDGPQRMTLEGDIERLDVWLAHGRLRVVGTDSPARIEVSKVGRKGVTVTLEEGVLSIRHGLKQGGWRRWAGPVWWFAAGRRSYNAELTVAVPPEAAGSLTVISGSVLASGLRRGARVDVTSGSVRLKALGGTVRAKTVSGSIEAMGVSGDLVMETVSGEISLAGSSAERVIARTISGSVTCDLDNPFTREVRLDTTSGGITVRVPEDADLDVSLSATSGRVTSAFPHLRPSGLPGMRSASGRIGTGAGTLRAYAVSGSVSLLASPADPLPDGPDAEGLDGPDGVDGPDDEKAGQR